MRIPIRGRLCVVVLLGLGGLAGCGSRPTEPVKATESIFSRLPKAKRGVPKVTVKRQ